jgi:hypothetical protein
VVSRISDVSSLVPLYEEAEQQQVVRFGFDNYVQHRLAFAFVLAKVGDLSRAHSELDRWCQLHIQGGFGPPEDKRPDLQRRLHELLDEAAEAAT